MARLALIIKNEKRKKWANKDLPLRREPEKKSP